MGFCYINISSPTVSHNIQHTPFSKGYKGIVVPTAL